MTQKIVKISVVGTGAMGTQIAILSASSGYDVAAFDIDEQSYQRTIDNFESVIKFSEKKPLLSLYEWEKGAEGVSFYKEIAAAVQGADLVIEAAPEDIKLKRGIFKNLDELAPRHAILATNSSSIPISRIESATNRPERCVNIHFYSLLMGVNMADVMGGSKTTAETMETAKGWVRSLGCMPLTVKKETLGFCFNRVWRTIKREVLHMWAGGYVDFKDIDRAWMISYGTRQGPFGMMDRIGLDVVYDIEMVYYNETKDPKDFPPEALKKKIDRKEIGIKTQKGFYTYPDPEYSTPDFLRNP